MHTYIHKCIVAYIHTHMHACTRVRTYVHTYIHTDLHIYNVTACTGQILTAYKAVRIIVRVRVMKAYAGWRRGGIVALLKLSFTLRPLFRGRNSPGYPLNVALMDPRDRLDVVKKIQSLASAGI